MEHYRDPVDGELLRFDAGRIAWSRLRFNKLTGPRARWLPVDVPPEQATRLERLVDDEAAQYEAYLRRMWATWDDAVREADQTT